MTAASRAADRNPWTAGMLAVVVGLSVTLAVIGGAPTSLARLTDADAIAGAFTTDVLQPPTDLAATGGSTIVLSWTPTSSAWASGYRIWRSTDAAGPYAEIADVTPRSATGFDDAPAPGTYHYLVRAIYHGWLSVGAGPVAASVASPTSTTGFQDCTGGSNRPVASGAGDNNGYETSASQACGFDGLFARDATSGSGGTESCGTGATPDTRKDQHQWWGFALGLPGTVSAIEGIEVEARLRLNNNGGLTNLCIQLSPDGGATWTSIKALDAAGGNDWTTYTFGGGSDRWGRSWTTTELEPTNLRVRVIDAAAQTTKTFQLDGLRVQVTYMP